MVREAEPLGGLGWGRALTFFWAPAWLQSDSQANIRGGGESDGGNKEGTGGFGEAGKQCPRSIIYSWIPRRRVSSWQQASSERLA